jgi:hypothetical protein
MCSRIRSSRSASRKNPPLAGFPNRDRDRVSGRVGTLVRSRRQFFVEVGSVRRVDRLPEKADERLGPWGAPTQLRSLKLPYERLSGPQLASMGSQQVARLGRQSVRQRGIEQDRPLVVGEQVLDLGSGTPGRVPFVRPLGIEFERGEHTEHARFVEHRCTVTGHGSPVGFVAESPAELLARHDGSSPRGVSPGIVRARPPPVGR